MSSTSAMLATTLALAGSVTAGVARSQSVDPRDNLISLHGAEKRQQSNILSLSDDATSKPEILKPIRPKTSRKRDERSDLFGIQHEDYLYWAGEADTLAELYIDLPYETEGIVDMEFFDDLIETMRCPEQGEDGSIEISFTDAADIDNAGEVWEWVNQEEDRHFLLMVGAGDCGWNDDRMLYHVHDIDYNAAKDTAVLDAHSISWKEALHSFDLSVGNVIADTDMARRFRKRWDWFDDLIDSIGVDINPDLSIPFESDLSGKGITLSANGVDLSGSCRECSTEGSFDVEAKFRTRLFDLEEAWVALNTPGLTATAVIDLTLRGELTDTIASQSLPIFSASPAGVAIPGVITIGPVLSISLDTSINAVKAGVTLTMGGVASIPASSSRLNFLDEDDSGSEGWEVEFEPIPLEADVFVETSVTTALKAAVGLELSALETGFAAELAAALPALTASLRGIHSPTCTACDAFQNGISGSVSIATSVTVALKQKNLGSFSNLFSLTLFDASLPPFVSFCEGIGEMCAANNTLPAQ